VAVTWRFRGEEGAEGIRSFFFLFIERMGTRASGQAVLGYVVAPPPAPSGLPDALTLALTLDYLDMVSGESRIFS
jgi:hypothetical protein